MLRRRLALVTVVSLCVVVGGLAVGGASASALSEHLFSGSFGGEGSGNGQLTGPSGVAVNAATHDVYVVDAGDNRVEQFTSEGAYVAQFNGSAAPSGAFSSPSAIAVDNSGNVLDPSAGDVYVIDTGHNVIDKFSSAGTYLGQLTESTGGAGFAELDGVAVDASGVVWVYQGSGEIDSFSDALGNEYLAKTNSPFGVSPGLAVDSEDSLYVHRGSTVFGKINTAGEALIEEFGEPSTAAAVDVASNDVFIDNARSVAAFTSAGSLIERFGDESGVAHLTAASGLAVDPGSGAVFVADSTADVVAVFDIVVVPDVATGAVSSLHATSATLNGAVNPGGIQLSDCRFEYGSDSSYGQSAPCVPAAASIPVDSSEHAVSAVLAGLTTGGSYHFRLVASNANGANAGQDQVLNVGPGLHSESVVSVGSSGATLRASIDPHGAPASYYFQYGTTTAYGGQIPAAPGASIGAGSGDVEVSQRVSGLQAGTVYHYRVVGLEQGSAEAFPGVDLTFTTQAVGGGSGLIDGRGWEMVSPEEKQGALIEPLGEGGLIQAAEDGGSIAYLAHSPIAAKAAGYKYEAQVLAKRGPGGWSSQELSPPSEVLPGQGYIEEGRDDYKLFSPDLSVGLLEPKSNAPLPPLPAGSGRTLYLREPASASYVPLVTTANVLPGATIEREETNGQINFQGASPDLSHVVFSASEAFTPNSVPSARNLYEWSAGRLAPVSVYPGGTPASGLPTFLGGVYFPSYDERIARHAVSADGSRVFWQLGEASNSDSLYLRDMVRGETVRLDEVRGGAGEGDGKPVFQTASSDGSRAFFTDRQALTADAISASGGVGGSLYVFEVAPGGGSLAGTLRDLTVDENVGERPEVLGAIPGASEDGSHVYFVANGALAPGAVHGNCNLTLSRDSESCNLYMVHFNGVEWSKPKLIAVLSELDKQDAAGNGGEGTVTMSSRVSPDGRYLAFMSARSLTGYDNRDAVTGALDEEAYLYDAATGHLGCVSCNPSGARPTGIQSTPGTSRLVNSLTPPMFESGLGLDGVLPPWTLALHNAMLYQSRYLSDNGRMFFDSLSALVPGDVNGKTDVYEFEPLGVGGCEPSTHGALVVFSDAAGGCVGLISSGTSGEESAFVEASARGGSAQGGEGGGDVFFVTASGLAAGDIDGAYDLYDAHECAGGPCPAVVSAGSSPPCASSEGCRGPLSQGAVFGAPASSTFAGGGNLTPPASTPVSKPKAKARGLSRAQKLARALRACRRKHGRQRVVCVARARRAFGARTSRARGATARSGR